MIRVTDGNIELALKQLKKQREEGGLHALMTRGSRLHAFQRPGVRHRERRLVARRRAAKERRQVEARELRRDPHGVRPRRPSPPKEVIAAAAAG